MEAGCGEFRSYPVESTAYGARNRTGSNELLRMVAGAITLSSDSPTAQRRLDF